MSNAMRLLGCVLISSATATCAAPVGEGTATDPQALEAPSADGPLHGRGMLNDDATGTFEATTGSLDSPMPPPSALLASVDLQVFDTTGALAFEQAFHETDPAAVFNWVGAHVARGQRFEIDASVDGSGAHTTFRDFVRYRPRLVLGAGRGIVAPDRGHGIVAPDRVIIVAPDRPVVDEPAAIFTVIRETNGDLGAKTDCSLSLDGAVVQTNTDINVAAGGFALCGFIERFPAAGEHIVAVSLGNISPTQANGSVTSVSETVSIVAPDHGGHRR